MPEAHVPQPPPSPSTPIADMLKDQARVLNNRELQQAINDTAKLLLDMHQAMLNVSEDVLERPEAREHFNALLEIQLQRAKAPV